MGEGPRPGPIVLDRSHVYILPTAQGLAFGALVVAMAGGSLNYNNSLGLLLAFLLAGLVFVAIVQTWSNLAGLTFRAGRIEPVFAGETARVPVRAEDAAGRPRWAVRLQRPRGSEPPAEDVPPDGAAFELLLPTSRRGALAPGRLVVETRFPLGLFRAWAHLEFDWTCTVYPRPGPPFPLPEQGSREDARTGRRGTGEEELSDLREYVPGDALRTLHWKASARADRLLVKRLDGGASDVLRLDWDAVPDPDPEARLSRLCRWVLDAHAGSRAWELRLPGQEIPAGSGREHLHRCLAALAHFPA